MIDVLAAGLLVAGALVTAVGGIGLVRFPDVFTRMHAATKAASVGVMLMTFAAAVEAGAASGLLILVLVVVLLFLSAPLGMSLLARAAYHDSQTPRWSWTRELHIDLPIPESTSVARTGGTSPSLAFWLFLAWVAVFGSLRPHVVVGGVVVSAVPAVALRNLAPRWPRALFHPVAGARFVGHFIVELFSATWDVATMVFRTIGDLRPAIVEVPIHVATRTEVMLLMSSVSFIPGTVALELHNDNLYLHVLSTKAPEIVVEEIVTMQRLISAAFGGAGRVPHQNEGIERT